MNFETTTIPLNEIPERANAQARGATAIVRELMSMNGQAKVINAVLPKNQRTQFYIAARSLGVKVSVREVAGKTYVWIVGRR